MFFPASYARYLLPNVTLDQCNRFIITALRHLKRLLSTAPNLLMLTGLVRRDCLARAVRTFAVIVPAVPLIGQRLLLLR